MESYSLLIVFLAMVAIWWWAWAPWKKRDPPPTQDSEPSPPNRKPRR